MWLLHGDDPVFVTLKTILRQAAVTQSYQVKLLAPIEAAVTLAVQPRPHSISLTHPCKAPAMRLAHDVGVADKRLGLPTVGRPFAGGV